MIELQLTPPHADTLALIPGVSDEALKHFTHLDGDNQDEYAAWYLYQVWEHSGDISSVVEKSYPVGVESFKSLLIHGGMTAVDAEQASWHMSPKMNDEKMFIYYTAAVLKLGYPIIPTLDAVCEDDTNLSKFVPVSSLVNLKDMSASLHEEGIVLSTRNLLYLSGNWDVSDVVELIRSGTSVNEARTLLQAGAKNLEEVNELMDSLPEELLEELFGF